MKFRRFVAIAEKLSCLIGAPNVGPWLTSPGVFSTVTTAKASEENEGSEASGENVGIAGIAGMTDTMAVTEPRDRRGRRD